MEDRLGISTGYIDWVYRLGIGRHYPPASPKHMTDTFLKTLQSVVAGARQLDEFAGVLVGTAVEDALLCVARDYGHDYALLLKKYKKDVVRRHASSTVTDKTLCRGTTKTNAKCTKRAQIQGYCLAHAKQLANDETERRNAAAYKASSKAMPSSTEATLAAMNKVMVVALGVVDAGRSKDFLVPCPDDYAHAARSL